MKRNYLAGILSCFLWSSVDAAAQPTIQGVSPIQVPVTQLNLNTADIKALSKSMKGIGIKRAEAIIKYRESHTGFKSVAELSVVPGIGKNFVSKHLEELQKIFAIK